MRIILFVFICCFGSVLSFGQKDALKRANEFFKNGKYQNALLELSRIPQTSTSGPLTYKKAICLYEINDIDKAIAELNKAENMGFMTDDMFYYKGRMMHHKGQFDLAIRSYKAYLKVIDIGHSRIDEVRDHIRHAGAAKDIIFIDPVASIENGGRNINSSKDESRFVQSTGKQSRFYFNSNRGDKSNKVNDYLGQSFETEESEDVDIFYVERQGDQWTPNQKLEDRSVNTYKNDGLIGLSADGNAVYVLRGKETDAMSDYELISQNGNAQSKHRMKALSEMIGATEDYHFFNDSTVLFASDQLGGEGGYDIFVTAYANGGWLAPKNLGPTVNSSNDERTPYLSNDGGLLIFSSNRRMSVGGYDIFRSYYLFEQKKWTSPKNIGLPINSPGNELHFRLSEDGLFGSYTSDRKDGYGQNDIYFAYLNQQEDHQAYRVKNLGFIDYPDFYIDKIDIPESQDIVSEATSEENLPELPTVQKIKKTINLPILTPNPDGDLFSKLNYEKLDLLANEIINSDVRHLEIMSFSDKEGIAEYNLFLSIKNAERIKDALIERGVDQNIIHLKGFGNYLPIIKPGIDQPSLTILNNRIQFKINLQEDHLIVNEESIPAQGNYINKGFEIFKTLIDDAVSYKIQIATVRQMYRGTALKLYNDVQVEKDETTGNYLYSVGLYDNFLEANSIMRELSEYGVTSLKIVPFVDGLRVDESLLVNYANEYPDLKDYIRSMTFTEREEED